MSKSSSEGQRIGKRAIQMEGQILATWDSIFCLRNTNICWVSKKGADPQVYGGGVGSP